MSDPSLHWDGMRWLEWNGVVWVPLAVPAPESSQKRIFWDGHRCWRFDGKQWAVSDKHDRRMKTYRIATYVIIALAWIAMMIGMWQVRSVSSALAVGLMIFVTLVAFAAPLALSHLIREPLREGLDSVWRGYRGPRPAPGWYRVPPGNELRWWDGATVHENSPGQRPTR